MAQRILGTSKLPEALKAEGFPLPEECAEMRVLMSARGAIILQYDVFLSADNAARLGRAFLRLAADEPTTNARPNEEN